MNNNETNRYSKGVLYLLDVTQLHENPDQPRRYFDQDALSDLENSIKVHGILEPILFTSDQQGRLVIVAGARRYKAAKNIGMDKVPGIYTNGSPHEIALIENLIRENLTAIEEAEALYYLVDEKGYTTDQLSHTLGKAKSTVSEILSLAKLPKSVRDACRSDSKYTRRILIELAKEPDEKSVLQLFNRIKKEKLTSNEVRKISRGKRTKTGSSILNLIASISNDLDTLEGKMTLADKENLQRELEKLRSKIDRILS